MDLSASSSTTADRWAALLLELGVNRASRSPTSCRTVLEFVAISLGDAADRRGLRAADADLPRARARVHAARERRARADRPATSSVDTTTRRWPMGCCRTRAVAGAVARARDGRRRPRRGRRVPRRQAPRDAPRSCCSPRARPASPRACCRPTLRWTWRRAMHIRHFGLTADDVIYIPSPLAHQTGFLYGMWIALRWAHRRSCRPSGIPRSASTRCSGPA